jgi:hypothetical protein
MNMAADRIVGAAPTYEDSQPQHRFVLQALDPVLGCPVLEAMLRVADLEMLRTLLGEDASDDAELRRMYVLSADDLCAITERFGVAFDADGRECWLSRAHSIGDVPYLVHTGYELALMLDGMKPFAKFSIEYPTEPGEFADEVLFEPHVRSGLLVKRVMDEPFAPPIRTRSGRVFEGTRQVFYACRGEEWRIDAYLLLWQQLKHGSWNETLERLDGSLLGYTDAQNDWWVARRRRHHASATFPDRTAYAAVTAGELAWIRAAGERALPPDGPEAPLELVMHGYRPESAALDDWIAASDAAAIVRFGLSRDFLDSREYRDRDGARCYLIARSEVPALNRALTSGVEIVDERSAS